MSENTIASRMKYLFVLRKPRAIKKWFCNIELKYVLWGFYIFLICTIIPITILMYKILLLFGLLFTVQLLVYSLMTFTTVRKDFSFCYIINITVTLLTIGFLLGGLVTTIIVIAFTDFTKRLINNNAQPEINDYLQKNFYIVQITIPIYYVYGSLTYLYYNFITYSYTKNSGNIYPVVIDSNIRKENSTGFIQSRSYQPHGSSSVNLNELDGEIYSSAQSNFL